VYSTGRNYWTPSSRYITLPLVAALSADRGRSIIQVNVQTAIYDSKVKLFLKQGISHQLGRDAVVRLIFCAIFFIHLKPRIESFWGVLSCCLTPSILFNFRYKKIKTYGWKKSGVGVLTLQCNSYLSHVRSFFKISSNFLSLTSSYPLLKMFFSTFSFLWTTAVGPRQNM
jgi:hypothetical protein